MKELRGKSNDHPAYRAFKINKKKYDKQKRLKLMKKIFITTIISSILLGGIFVFGVYELFYDMGSLPKGDYLMKSTSPDGNYTVKTYVANGGATVDYSIRGELVFNNGKTKKKNIYWNYHEENANISWNDNDTVVINGHKLDVPDDKYDFRNINH